MLTNRQLFLLNVAQTSGSPRLLEIECAKGLYLYDTAGKAYMDLVSGFAVSNTGHGHPEIVQAIKNQVDLYMHLSVYGEFVQSPQVKLAQKITSLLPESLNSVYFTNSGTEAAEGAIKLAKRFTGRSEIIACKNGVRVPDSAYMLLLRQKCDETGTLLILDEIQSGLGRTGKLFAFEHFNIVPDILLTAKAFGGGMPLGAFIAPKHVMDALKENPILGHITTFGGHPVCCAAGLASLEVILKEELIKNVSVKEALFRKLLYHPEIKEVRGKGLMLSIQLSSFNQVENVSKRCVENGVIVDWFLHCETALRIAPPLIISLDEIRKACAVILEAINFCAED
ncbi:MAG: aspartate aminotransferase family protein [Sphingobacteriaceae bacterium]|nr:MAG: aspartate aminotransferase family protein [Sphingobacteriaceae bacterium]